MFSVPTMAVVKGRDGIDVGLIAREAVTECGMSHKEAAIIQGYPDATQWAKALRGQAPLDLWYMRHMPNRYWQVFLPKFASALIRQLWVDMTSDFRMAKADLSTSEQDERKRA
jgi:hypothetical protein